MELQRIIWSWETIAQRLLKDDPDIGQAAYRSCRPIAAQRYRDGRLLVVLGCWWAEHQAYLSKEPNHARLNDAFGKLISERVATVLVRWPGGMAEASADETDEGIPAPDILKGLPDEAREEASKCESAIQRLFYATAYRNGLRLRCQHHILNYRIDFALPERRVGAEIMGWDMRVGPRQMREAWEREEQLEGNGWRILSFSGSQVLSDVDKCFVGFAAAVQSVLGPGQRTLPTKYASEARKPFSSLGKHPHSDGSTRRRER